MKRQAGGRMQTETVLVCGFVRRWVYGYKRISGVARGPAPIKIKKENKRKRKKLIIFMQQMKYNASNRISFLKKIWGDTPDPLLVL